MTRSDVAAKAMTVLGPVDPDSLGITVTHEHLLLDFEIVYEPPRFDAEGHLADEEISLHNLGWVRFNWTSSHDNLQLDNEQLAVAEAGYYAEAGGGTIVDVTSVGLRRSPQALERISRATGLNVVMGAGYYVDAVHPDDFAEMSVDQVTARIVADVEEGADGTDVRSGIIGEVGCSWPWSDGERKSVAAATAAQVETGAALLIHPGRSERAPLEILDFIQREGGDLRRTIMGHIDRTIFTPSILDETAAAGACLEFDLFGHESSFYPLNQQMHMQSDHERIESIMRLLAEGYGDSIVLAHDICSKHRLRAYGGHGWDHIVTRIVPWMKARGMTDDQVTAMLVDTPKRLLTFA